MNTSDLSDRVFDLATTMNKQRAAFIRQQQEAHAAERAEHVGRLEAATQAVQDRLERDHALSVGRPDYPFDFRTRAEEYVAAMLAQLRAR